MSDTVTVSGRFKLNPTILLDAIERRLTQLGASADVREYVLFTIELESGITRVSTPAGKGYRPEMGGTFKGLGQFSRTTWNSLHEAGLIEVPYETGVGTIYDVDAIVALREDSYHSFVRNHNGKTFTKEVAYGYHNQGVPSFEAFLSANDARPDHRQSDEARRVLSTAWEQVHG